MVDMMEQVPACPVVEAMLVAGTRCAMRDLWSYGT